MTNNLADDLDQHAKERGDQAALLVAGRRLGRHIRLSFHELSELTRRYAAGMAEDGVHQGTKVLMMVPPSVDMVAITWALYRIGAVPVFIDPGMGIKAMLRCIRKVEPEVLVGIPKAHLLSLTIKRSFATLRLRISVGSRFSLGGSSTRGYRKSDLPWTENAKVQDNDLSAILFTSGSTGAPKGVEYQFTNFKAQLNLLREHFKLTPGSVDLPLLPVFSLFNPALGITSVLPRVNPSKPAKLDPNHVMHLIEAYDVDHSFGAPVLWQKIIRHAQSLDTPIPQIKRLLMAGSSVPPDLVELAKTWTPHADIATPYGATEALPLTIIEGDELLGENKNLSEAGQGNCVGRPLPGIQIKIIPIQDGPIEEFDQILECQKGEIGEILASGPVVTTAYHNLHEATKKAKVKIGSSLWHRMGDLGYLDEEGRLWYCGRVAHMIPTSRGPLYSVCIEAIFNQHPAVFRSALIGLGGKAPYVPALVLELERGVKVSHSRLCLELMRLGGQHQQSSVIRNFYLHPSFPVDVRHNTKIHRHALSKWAAKQVPINII
jgi:acyl-CoA synthetase (AMP-forming)/AMP-acid ligase II